MTSQTHCYQHLQSKNTISDSEYSDLNIHFDFYLPCKLVNAYTVFEVQLPILHNVCQHQTLALNF